MSLDQFHRPEHYCGTHANRPGGLVNVRKRLDGKLRPHIYGSANGTFVYVGDALDALTPPVEAVVEALDENPELKDCWGEDDAADGNRTPCASTDLPKAAWCWPCRANAALAPFREGS